ncbi:MAG TPA: D-glycero-beta-D-manno-heptose 1-phosphate adenylyltransferase [Candidatus Omnitrophota bacterium]|nr:D-glycero-beta-D-manno-heptose 1-phosphate adenylyltransferase [Candidatus Omnitrophota bacterium]
MKKKIVSLFELKGILSKKSGKVVFTNGCFDIIHAGHVKYLAQARSKGDILVVGLNSDSSIRRLKGKTRPVNNQNDRAKVLAGLEAVDYIVLFSQDTPYDLIKTIRPDILVKGGDWKKKDIIGSDIVGSYGGKTITVPYLPNRSTTSILKKIRAL